MANNVASSGILGFRFLQYGRSPLSSFHTPTARLYYSSSILTVKAAAAAQDAIIDNTVLKNNVVWQPSIRVHHFIFAIQNG